ncbi:hypothetical protein D3C73_1078380 [compost metagenome]
MHQRQVVVLAAFVFPALEHRRQQVKLRQHVTQARRDHFAALQPTAQLRQGGVGQQREARRIAPQPPIVARRGAGHRRRRQQTARPRAADGAQRVLAGVPQVAPEDIVKDLDAALFVGVGQRHHFRHQVRMRADGALPEDDQVARQDVGAFDRDRDGHRAIQRAQVVAGAVHDGAPGVHVHRGIDGFAHAFGGVVFHDARHDGGLHVLVQRGAGQAPGRFNQIGVARQAGQLFLHAFELADGNAELLAHPGVHARGVRAHDGGRGRQ